jgi:hypothetical protein
MMMSIDELYDRVLALSANVEDTFLDLGRSLRQLLDRDPGLFQQIVKKGRLGRRRAYYLVEVSRKFDPLPISRARLKKIGWTKLPDHRPACDEGQRRGTRQPGRAIEDQAA